MNEQTGALRVAIIGCGNMGRTHARTLAALPGAEVAILVDPVAESIVRLQREVELVSVRTATTPEAAFDDPTIDAVVIATHHDLHPRWPSRLPRRANTSSVRSPSR